MGQSEIMDEWMGAILTVISAESLPEMVREDRSQSEARSDVKCGLAMLHYRYELDRKSVV